MTEEMQRALTIQQATVRVQSRSFLSASATILFPKQITLWLLDSSIKLRSRRAKIKRWKMVWVCLSISKLRSQQSSSSGRKTCREGPSNLGEVPMQKRKKPATTGTCSLSRRLTHWQFLDTFSESSLPHRLPTALAHHSRQFEGWGNQPSPHRPAWVVIRWHTCGRFSSASPGRHFGGREACNGPLPLLGC